MKMKYVSEKDFSEKMVDVDDVQYNILKEISRVHPQSYRDLVHIGEDGEPTIIINRGETRIEKENNSKSYRIRIEKI
jgi:hypothetical protein